MANILNEWWLYVKECYDMLIHCWFLRAILGSFGAMIIWLIEIKHVQVLGIFVVLVLIDLVTKWGAISYQMLIADGKSPDMPVQHKYLAIPEAFSRKLISSNYMRKGFVKKIATYVFATSAAFLFDSMSGQNQFLVNAVWIYLGGAEFLSIMENLRDGGNEQMGKFLELVRNKIENKVRM